MATVYRCFDERLQVTRAVKILSEEFSDKPRIRARFEAEARTMAVLDHANIVRVYDVGSEGSTVYIVMELVDGMTLLQRIEQGGAVPPPEALQITRAMLDGIRAAHAQHIIHRDIKPHNILLSSDGRVRITDFGIARSNHITEESFTKTGAVMGTWAFMAPEQRVNSKGVDERADLYGVGATLFAMVTKRTPMDLFASDLDPVMLRDVPDTVLPLIRMSTRYQPDERYVDAQAMLTAVDDALASAPTASAPIRTPPPAAPETTTQARPYRAAAEATYLPDGAIAMVHSEAADPAPAPPPSVIPASATQEAPARSHALESGTLLPDNELEPQTETIERAGQNWMIIGLIGILIMTVTGAVGMVVTRSGPPPASNTPSAAQPTAPEGAPEVTSSAPEGSPTSPTSAELKSAEKQKDKEREERERQAKEEEREAREKREQEAKAADQPEAEAPEEPEEPPAPPAQADAPAGLKLVPSAPGSGTIGSQLHFSARIPSASTAERKGYNVVLSYRATGGRFKRPRTMRQKAGTWKTSFTVTPDMAGGVEWCMFAKADPVKLPQHPKLTAVSCRSPKRVQIR